MARSLRVHAFLKKHKGDGSERWNFKEFPDGKVYGDIRGMGSQHSPPQLPVYLQTGWRVKTRSPLFTDVSFEERTLGGDFAHGLAAYETLIVELGKHLYLKEHSERQRVPIGFTSCFRLNIERLDEGSIKRMLSLVLSGVMAFTGGEQDYYDRAGDLMAECIAVLGNALPRDFPKELLVHFN